MPTLVERFDSIQYDGTNGTYIDETYLSGGSYSVHLDTGTALTLTDGQPNEPSYTVIPLNGWIVKQLWSNMPQWTGSNSAYLARWAEAPLSDD